MEKGGGGATGGAAVMSMGREGEMGSSASFTWRREFNTDGRRTERTDGQANGRPYFRVQLKGVG